MVIRKRRIETPAAAQRRSRRQRLAAPGGNHDRLVRFLAFVLPVGIGVIAAFMIITPLSPRGEISFLLDRNEVAVINERMRVDNALYRGQDAKGRPFSLTADEAVQRSSVEGIVRMDDLVARLLMNEGPARVEAPGGRYDINEEIVAVNGTLRMVAADGYRMRASGVALDLREKTLEGAGGVEGAIPAGTFAADRLDADLEARQITLTGNARLRMVPGKLRMP